MQIKVKLRFDAKFLFRFYSKNRFLEGVTFMAYFQKKREENFSKKDLPRPESNNFSVRAIAANSMFEPD
jgi:hypothetical protein